MPHSSLILDLRAIPRQLGCPSVAHTFEALGGGESLHVVDERDLASLFDLFIAQYPGIFDWIREESGPRLWRVRIDRLVP